MVASSHKRSDNNFPSGLRHKLYCCLDYFGKIHHTIQYYIYRQFHAAAKIGRGEPLRIRADNVTAETVNRQSFLTVRVPISARWLSSGEDSQQGRNRCTVIQWFAMAGWMLAHLGNQTLCILLGYIYMLWFIILSQSGESSTNKGRLLCSGGPRLCKSETNKWNIMWSSITSWEPAR